MMLFPMTSHVFLGPAVSAHLGLIVALVTLERDIDHFLPCLAGQLGHPLAPHYGIQHVSLLYTCCTTDMSWRVCSCSLCEEAWELCVPCPLHVLLQVLHDCA